MSERAGSVAAAALAAILVIALASEAFALPRDEKPAAVPDYTAQPYYLVPADQPVFPEYELAIRALVAEVQDWYAAKANLRFEAAPLLTIHSADDYLTMRCGADPAERRKGEADIQHMPAWLGSVESGVGGFRPRRIAWVFAQGGGGWAGGNLYGEDQGFAIFGDWVLEPIAGKPNPQGITAALATWQVQGGVPKGTTVHELGHALGLHHPDGYEGKTIMAWHGDYPDTGLHPHEVLLLRESPWFSAAARARAGPRVDYSLADAAEWGEELLVPGRGFREGDEVEFVDARGSRRVKPESLTEDELRVRVPSEQGPGFLRSVRGEERGNAVAINLYERRPK